MDKGNPEGLGLRHPGNPDWFPLPTDFPCIRRMHPGQRFHQSAFTGPVFPHHGHHFARMKPGTHSGERLHTGKAFGEIDGLENWLRGSDGGHVSRACD